MSSLEVAILVALLLVFAIDRGLSITNDDDITKQVFKDETVDMFPVAVGDYDSDRVMDTIFLSKNLSFFQIYFGYSSSPYLRPRAGFSCETNGKIVGLALADFTGDGVLDILTTIDEGSYKSVHVFKGNPHKFECRGNAVQFDGNRTELKVKDEPLIVDVNGDMIADLVGELQEEDGRKIWLFEDDGKVKMVNMKCGSSVCPPLSVPHVSAFADLDGDFSPELIMISRGETTDGPSHKMEVYSIAHVQKNNEPEFIPYEGQPFDFGNNRPKRIGNFLLLDLEQIGRITPMIPFCSDVDCNSSGFMIHDGANFKVLTMNFTDEKGMKWGFVVPESTPYDQAITLRVGDVNLDGYPDLIGTVRPLSGNESKSLAAIFYNVPCKSQPCSNNHRTFELKTELSKYDDAVNAIFYDFYDNGLLDVMIVRKNDGKANSTGSYKVQAVVNTPKYDGYFLKLMMTSKNCLSEYCPPYGAVLPGASMNYTMADNRGEMQCSKAAQFYRSAHFPVDLPYVLIGTGATPNFIDTVWIGMCPFRGSVSVHKWRQIIPNSHLVVTPYRDGWKLRHFLSPNEEGAWSTLKALLLILFINGVIVFVLWLKERKEDRKNVQMRGTLNFVRLT